MRLKHDTTGYQQRYLRAGAAVETTSLVLSRGSAGLIFGFINFPEGSSLVADLTTMGRKSGRPRTVELRLIYYQGCFYASSSRVTGKHWCLNILRNPVVELSVKGERRACIATQVTDDQMRRRILTFRDSPPQLDRVVFAIKPRERL
jgi:deazaflavin-dependent oxidoreductase (nitroreductase family)